MCIVHEYVANYFPHLRSMTNDNANIRSENCVTQNKATTQHSHNSNKSQENFRFVYLFVTTVIHFNFIQPKQMVARYYTTVIDACLLYMHNV